MYKDETLSTSPSSSRSRKPWTGGSLNQSGVTAAVSVVWVNMLEAIHCHCY